MGEILTDSFLDNLYLLIQLKIIEKENFDGSLAKHQIHQYLPPSKYPTIR